MSTYTVHLTQVVSTARTVEADDVAAAMDAAQECGDLPRPGSMVGENYDGSGEWELSAVEDETGAEVWSEDAERAALARAEREHLAAVTAERDRLRVEVERLRAIEQRAREYVDDTTLAHPSASETVLHTAMREVLEGPDAADPLEGQWADVDLIRAAVMTEVEHCVWASTGGRATMNAEERTRVAAAEAVKDYLTRGGLDASLFRVVTDPRLGQWKREAFRG